MNNYKLEISKDELLGMLSNYYTRILGHKIKVEEKSEIEYFGLYENKGAKVTLYYEETIDILGHKATKTTNISEEELKKVLNELIKESGYMIDTLMYNKGVRLEGYYRDEIEVSYFNGIELTLREKGKELVKK